MEGESIYSAVAFIGRSASSNTRQSGNRCVCCGTSGELAVKPPNEKIYKKKSFTNQMLSLYVHVVIFVFSLYSTNVVFTVLYIFGFIKEIFKMIILFWSVYVCVAMYVHCSH